MREFKEEFEKDYKEELDETKKLKKPLTRRQKKSALNQLDREIEASKVSLDANKEKFIDQIKKTNVLTEIKTTKENNLTFFDRVKIILGLK